MARSQLSAGAFRPDRVMRRLVDLLGPTGGLARQSLTALGFNSLTSFAAGAMLVGFSGTWERLPPMLILVPAAIGLRGNVFSTMGSRLSTAIHAGTFSRSFRADSVLGQNLIAAFGLTVLMSAVLACFAQVIAVVIGIENPIGLLDLMLISVLGGVLGSIVVAGATVLLTSTAIERGWDLDNLVAPAVSTLGDVVTIPALWLAAQLVGIRILSPSLGATFALGAAAVTIYCLRSQHQLLREVFRESIPVLSVALALSAFAGVILQNQQHILTSLPAVGILQPAFVSSAGALGGILAGRISTNLHIGIVEPTLNPGSSARSDISLVFAMSTPIIIFNVVGAWVVSSISGDPGVGFGWLLLLSMLAFFATMAFVGSVSYYSTIGAWRLSVDPDSYGTPLVTASVDFIGTMALVFAVAAL